jgi:zinc/manganese transport system permease protein
LSRAPLSFRVRSLRAASSPWVLGLGAPFLSLYTSSARGTHATPEVSVLFGTIFGLSSGQAVTDTAVTLGVCGVMVLIARPLLFASLDAAGAQVRGVRVRALDALFLALVGVTPAAATQAVGALLLLGLLAAPAGAAQRLTSRPFRGFWLSAAIAIGSVWAGLLIANSASVDPAELRSGRGHGELPRRDRGHRARLRGLTRSAR